MIGIRRARKEDAPKVLTLIRGIMQSEFAPAEQEAYPLDDVQALPDSYRGKRDAFFVAAEPGGKPLGVCGIKEEGDGVGLLRRIFVDTRHRRRRLGERLIRHAIDFCRKKGYRVITVRTTDRMQAGIGLLSKAGFRERGAVDAGRVRILKLTYDCRRPTTHGRDKQK